MRLAVASDIHVGAASSPGLPWLVDAAREHAHNGARALIVAGDLVHRDVEPARVVPALVDALSAIAADLPVLAIYGNHDAAAGLPGTLPEIEGVHIIGSLTPVEVRLPEIPLLFHCVSVASDPDPRQVIEDFPVAPAPEGHVGVFHSSLSGRHRESVCLPASVDKLASLNYSAWVLGHIHEALTVSEHPPIFFPGQGRMRVLDVPALPTGS